MAARNNENNLEEAEQTITVNDQTSDNEDEIIDVEGVDEEEVHSAAVEDTTGDIVPVDFIDHLIQFGNHAERLEPKSYGINLHLHDSFLEHMDAKYQCEINHFHYTVCRRYNSCATCRRHAKHGCGKMSDPAKVASHNEQTLATELNKNIQVNEDKGEEIKEEKKELKTEHYQELGVVNQVGDDQDDLQKYRFFLGQLGLRAKVASHNEQTLATELNKNIQVREDKGEEIKEENKELKTEHYQELGVDNQVGDDQDDLRKYRFFLGQLGLRAKVASHNEQTLVTELNKNIQVREDKGEEIKEENKELKTGRYQELGVDNQVGDDQDDLRKYRFFLGQLGLRAKVASHNEQTLATELNKNIQVREDKGEEIKEENKELKTGRYQELGVDNQVGDDQDDLRKYRFFLGQLGLRGRNRNHPTVNVLHRPFTNNNIAEEACIAPGGWPTAERFELLDETIKMLEEAMEKVIDDYMPQYLLRTGRVPQPQAGAAPQNEPTQATELNEDIQVGEDKGEEIKEELPQTEHVQDLQPVEVDAVEELDGENQDKEKQDKKEEEKNLKRKNQNKVEDLMPQKKKSPHDK